MKIISWNLNDLLASMKNGVQSVFEDMQPDIICLQEIRTQQEPVILDCYHHFWNHGDREGYSGTAILTRKKPLRAFTYFLSNFEDDEGRLITIELENAFVVNAYVPNSQQNLKRQENQGWRLDYFLVSDDLMESVNSVSHLSGIEGSEHCPIELELEL